MTLDPSRATFVVREFRYAEAIDSAVKATYDDAREIVIDTNMSEAAANSLATAILAAEKVSKRAFEVMVRKAISADDFVSGPPRYTYTDAKSDASSVATKVVAVSTDWRLNTTRAVLKSI